MKASNWKKIIDDVLENFVRKEYYVYFCSYCWGYALISASQCCRCSTPYNDIGYIKYSITKEDYHKLKETSIVYGIPILKAIYYGNIYAKNLAINKSDLALKKHNQLKYNEN